ncbi:MAG: ABC transporter permease subunit [Rhodanobacteraceae bacterium]
MRATGLIAGNEWRRQFVQPFAWMLIAIVLALTAYQFLIALGAYLELMPKLGALKDAPGVTDLVAIPLLRAFANLSMLLVPLITMRTIAGERRGQTLSLLLASGIGNARIVLGKYLGALGLAWLILAVVLLLPLTLELGSTLDLGKLAAAALGLALYIGALTAIGLLASALTAQPALAAGAALAIAVLLSIVDAGARMEGIDNASINYLASGSHLEPFLRGLVASVDIVYFLLLTGFALTLAVWRLDALRGRID